MDSLNFKDALHFKEFSPISLETWESVIESDLKGKDYKEVLRWDTREGIEPLPFYRSEHLEKLPDSSTPLNTDRSWAMVEPITSNDLSVANQMALHALENGASGLSFEPSECFIQNSRDLKTLLKGIQLDIITLSFGNTLSTPQILSWFSDYCKENDLTSEELQVFFHNDLMSYSVMNGLLPTSDHLRSHLGTFHNLTIDTSTYTNAGATIVQQLAFALGSLNEYLGLTTDAPARTLVKFATGPHYFLEIAKYRAFRLMIGQVLEAYDYDAEGKKVQVLAETAYWNKAKNDAHNNLLRVTTEAMAAALGGCDQVLVHPYNEHFDEPSSFSSRIARNCQLILQEEAYLDKVADPGAGSYYIEELTHALSKESWEMFREIENQGGFYACLEKGLIQQWILESREQKIQAYKAKQMTEVGVNKYQPEEQEPVDTPHWDSPPPVSDTGTGPGDQIEISSVPVLNIEAELQDGGKS